MDFLKFFSGKYTGSSFKKELKNILGFKPRNVSLYQTALTHRSIRENADENNERLEYLGDAILSALVADYLFKRYPYKEEGFLTEMRSKMVNRQQLNEIAVRMGLKKVTLYNKMDGALKVSQIFGNTLEALVGAIYLDHGYKKTSKWVMECIILPHMFMDDLEILEINHKNKLYGWANKNGKVLEFETLNEKLENGRRLFTVAAMVDGKNIAEGKAYNKKDASQIAAQVAVDKLGIVNADSVAEGY
ncbi:MAG: ribonuclease III [Chitinophagaceae bacterium]|nr:ribonuclease III [Chitinophagaceae bacterium]MBP7107149.1 ribonuclease III [Chitinophagaceae bacterium]MBP7314836.1 ribonuclease III [Chitinophagaceae bacterium]HQV54570.1 ribonuclease III [Chitinophagaceae bacterium]HQX96290.1 ribonuclease III [Chitinophagaceae bacterium]